MIVEFALLVDVGRFFKNTELRGFGGVSLYENRNDNEEGVIVSVTVLSMDMTAYDSLFLGNSMNGTGC